MRVWIVMLGLAVLITGLIIVTAAEKGNVKRGKEVFARCSVCHGTAGEGKEAIGKMFGVTMKPLGSKEIQSFDDAVLGKTITGGKGKMPAVKLTDQELADVISFLRTLKK